MHYLDNITLTILIALLRDGVLTISTPDMKSLEELSVYISTLDCLFMNRPTNMSIEEEEEFTETYVPTIVYENNSKELNIHCNNIKKLEIFLKEYAKNYKGGSLEEEDANEFNTIGALHNTLIRKANKVPTNKTHYIEIDIKYTPLILLKFFENNMFVQRLTVQLAPREEMPYPMILFERNLDGTPNKYVKDWQSYFHCKYVLNMNWYINEYNRSISRTVVRKRRENFAPLTNDIYTYLLNNAKEGVFHLSRTDLKNCMTLANKDKKLNDLRVQYREIYRKLPDFDIISYNRSTKLYDIHKDILTDKLN